MHWCLQENLNHETGYQDLIDLLDRSGLPYTLHKVIPFVGELVPDIDVEGPVMCMGSYSMRHVARAKGWEPGVFDLAEFDYDAQVRAWPGHMLNEGSVVCTFAEVPARIPAESVFIRPVADSKFFAGGVMAREELEPWVASVCDLKEDYGDSLSASTVVMMSEPKTILREYRTWVIGGKVATASLYKSGGRVLYSGTVDDDVIAYANDRAAEFSPLDGFVMDIALMDDGFKIIECNTANAAGIYAADVGKIVEAIEGLVDQ